MTQYNYGETLARKLLADKLSAQRTLQIPLGGGIDIVTGAPLLAYTNSSNALPGLALTNSKAVSIRWNNHAAPTQVGWCIAMPQDLDDGADVVFHALCSKTGATTGDATSLTVAAYEQTVAALHDADTDFGGATTALVGAAIAKTVAELTLTLALADIHAAPSCITLLVAPTAGLLGTDDFILHACWLEYTAQLLSS